ncbi:hypothetical protein J2S92_001800 [Arthrobacter bambusae]|nr:hypothetical protein [Arthrobacter bambusae]MDQ0234428.1 hypothetical protein [Arthrobacter bambusae]
MAVRLGGSPPGRNTSLSSRDCRPAAGRRQPPNSWIAAWRSGWGDLPSGLRSHSIFHVRTRSRRFAIPRTSSSNSTAREVRLVPEYVSTARRPQEESDRSPPVDHGTHRRDRISWCAVSAMAPDDGACAYADLGSCPERRLDAAQMTPVPGVPACGELGSSGEGTPAPPETSCDGIEILASCPQLSSCRAGLR